MPEARAARPPSDGPISEATASARLRLLAAEHPDRLFADGPMGPVTLGDLDRDADRIAAGLVEEMGPGESPVVVLTADLRSLATAALGVARAGKTVVILDPDSPEQRLGAILDDLGCRWVFADTDSDAGMAGRASRAVATFGCEGARPAPVDQARVASIRYTSGSTGTPKGVMIPTSARDALGQGLALFSQVDGERAPYFTGNSWGDAIIHAAILAGVTLVPFDVKRDGTAHMAAWMEQQGIGIVAGVPTLLRAMLATMAAGERLPVHLVVSNGETLQWADVAELRRHTRDDLTVVNIYGLTESATVAVNIISPASPLGRGPVPPGLILPSLEVEIVEEGGAPAAPGCPGEIVVTGPQVMLGYWRRPELTDRVLTVLPDGRRRLRTGDGGRLEPDGTLVHLGRLDHVVKVSGHRIELGEVEAGLARLASVAAAAAGSYDDSAGDVRLIAFVVPRSGHRPSPLGLRAELSRVLPAWMLPDRVVVVDELPRLANGKVDRSFLPATAEKGAVAAGDGAQAAVLALYRRILDRSDVGPDDSFFDAGGDSIRAAALFASIADRLGYDRPPAMLLDFPSARQLAAALQEEDTSSEVLSFNVGGDQRPLVVIHDGSGDVGYARTLAAELGPDRPVHAIRGRALDGVQVPYKDLTELAGAYLSLLEPLGLLDAPLCLAGFSLGGLVAFEMALQVEDAGGSVDGLFAGDTMWPDARRATPPRRRADRLRQAVEQRDLAAAARITAEHVAWTRQQLSERVAFRRARRLLDSNATVPLRYRYHFALYQYGILAEAYRPPRRFTGSVILLRALGFEDLPDLGWGPHVEGEVTVEHLPCHHVDVCREKGMPVVAAAIRPHLS